MMLVARLHEPLQSMLVALCSSTETFRQLVCSPQIRHLPLRRDHEEAVQAHAALATAAEELQAAKAAVELRVEALTASLQVSLPWQTAVEQATVLYPSAGR